MIIDNQQKYSQLRKEYNVFIYERFDYALNIDKILLKFQFNLSDKYTFSPELIIHLDERNRETLTASYLDNLVFHIGLVELISYWKASCSPRIIIKPFKLNEEQLQFWKKLYFNGLGEFFYLNNISTDIDDFVSIECKTDRSLFPENCELNSKKVLLPVGGGKDSVVSLELLKDRYKLIPFIVNPRAASLESVYNAGISEKRIVKVTRTIHPQLLKLNKLGFLNGHTPFSALLAFVTLLVSSLKGAKYIALSNESSANEPTVADGPNHQYSKSFEFENDFRKYVLKTINAEIQYFSFLRPLSEYKIASIFSKFPQHFKSFKSCNVGSKDDSWCGACPKCLFTAIILSPFIDSGRIKEIFGKDIFNDIELLPALKELAGISEVKPFECVGTVNEVNLALVQTLNDFMGNHPALLKYYKKSEQYKIYNDQGISEEMKLKEEHFLPEAFIDILTLPE